MHLIAQATILLKHKFVLQINIGIHVDICEYGKRQREKRIQTIRIKEYVCIWIRFLFFLLWAPHVLSHNNLPFTKPKEKISHFFSN